MQVNFDCNISLKPVFGMAFRKPHGKALSELSDYVGLEKEVNRKGFAQFIKEQQNNKRFDIEYLTASNTAQIVDTRTEKVLDTFHGVKDITGLNHFGAVSYPGKELLAKIFNPKQFLPYNILLAGEKANKLEAEALQKEASEQFVQKLL